MNGPRSDPAEVTKRVQALVSTLQSASINKADLAKALEQVGPELSSVSAELTDRAQSDPLFAALLTLQQELVAVVSAAGQGGVDAE
jgi:hypothetical protein